MKLKFHFTGELKQVLAVLLGFKCSKHLHWVASCTHSTITALIIFFLLLFSQGKICIKIISIRSLMTVRSREWRETNWSKVSKRICQPLMQNLRKHAQNRKLTGTWVLLGITILCLVRLFFCYLMYVRFKRHIYQLVLPPKKRLCSDSLALYSLASVC